MVKKLVLIFIIISSIFHKTLYPSDLISRNKKNINIPLNFLPRNTDNIKRTEKIINKNLTPPTTSGTVIFEESFEGTTGFPPSGWKTINNDGGGTTGPWFQGNTSVFPAYSGTGYAAANYQGANDFLIDEWLITPRLIGINSTDTLSFWHRSPDYSAWDDSIEIRISTTDTNPVSFNKLVDYFKTSTAGWAQKKYPLKNFITDGSNIYIAFRYLIYDGGISGLNSDYVGIDLVQILRPKQQYDIKTVSIDFPLNNSKIIFGNPIEPTATFRNAGVLPVNNIPVRLKIISPSGNVYEDSRTINTLSPDQTIQVTFNSYTVNQIGKYFIQIFSSLSNDQNRTNDTINHIFKGANLYAGVYTVGTGGRFSSLKQAIDTLTENIISNDIILSLINSYYNEQPILIRTQSYLTDEKRIYIKPASNISPTINVNATAEQPYGISIFGASKIIIDGSNSQYPQRNLKINVNGINGKKGIFIGGSFEANSDSNIIKNLIIQTGADSLSNSSDYTGIILSGYNSTYKDIGNKIINCDISKHGSAGIIAQFQEGLLIEKNIIHDWIQYAGENDLYGILLYNGITNSIVSKNKIGNLKNYNNYYWVYGIEIDAGAGSNILFSNNMIYNILSAGAGNFPNLTRAIFSSNLLNSGDKYYYNSIYLSGTDLSSSNQSRISGFEFIGGRNIELKNNIIMNEATLPNSNGKAYCIYLHSLPNNFYSNHNNFYAPNSSGAIGFYQTNKLTLSEWSNSFTPKLDSSSLNVNPFFVSPLEGDLHIQTTSNSQVNNTGIPLSLVQDDIDDTPRSTTNPDIGADEFTPVNFSINVNYGPLWNLVSVPLLVPDYQKSIIFPNSISNAYSFSGVYTISNILTNGVGYWLKFPHAVKQTFGGDPLPNVNIVLTKGWNLIGSVDHTIPVPDVLTLESAVFGYNQGYTITDSIYPGKAYWIKVSRDTTLMLGNYRTQKSIAKKNYIDKQFNKIKISNLNGFEQILYFGLATEQINKPIEMPPAMSFTEFDVRFANNNILEVLNPINSSHHPITIIRNNTDKIKILWDILETNQFKYELIINDSKIKTTMIIENIDSIIIPQLQSLILKTIPINSNKPTFYELQQNYPNPFNSTTVIKFNLPDRSSTKITVHNLLGQKIYTAVDEILDAGYHKVILDESITNFLASGTYFYQMDAVSLKDNKHFRNTKKFLILK